MFEKNQEIYLMPRHKINISFKPCQKMHKWPGIKLPIGKANYFVNPRTISFSVIFASFCMQIDQSFCIINCRVISFVNFSFCRNNKIRVPKFFPSAVRTCVRESSLWFWRKNSRQFLSDNFRFIFTLFCQFYYFDSVFISIFKPPGIYIF